MKIPAPSMPEVRSRRAGRWRWALIVGIVVCVQSTTITLPITVKYVDAQSNTPIARLPVTAVWSLIATHPAGSLPSTVLKVQHLETNQAGEVSIGPAAMVHAPTFPFSVNLRRARSLPTLYVVDQRYEARLTSNDPYDPQRPAPLSVLSLQRTSIDGAIVRLLPALQAGAGADRDDEHMRNLWLSEIRRADELCRQRWWCQED